MKLSASFCDGHPRSFSAYWDGSTKRIDGPQLPPIGVPAPTQSLSFIAIPSLLSRFELLSVTCVARNTCSTILYGVLN